MFYDKDSMLEMVELSIGKKKWKHILVTSELFGTECHSITTKEIVSMHRDWKESVKKIIDKEDAAYLINQGNIFCLTQDLNIPKFKKQLDDIALYSSNYQGGIRASLIFLTNKETEFLLKMS